MAFEFSRLFGAHRIGLAENPGSLTNSPIIDSAYVHRTSGDGFLVFFASPVSQTSATLTLYAYCGNVTGTPTFEMGVYDEYDGTGDADRPDDDGGDIATSPSSLSLSSADNNTWVSLTCTVSLTAGKHYWVVVKNTSGTPGSNYTTFSYRGSLDSMSDWNTYSPYGFQAGYTTDGISTDSNLGFSGYGSAVLLFGDGSLIGMPYVSVSYPSSSTNSRGNRITLPVDTVVSGIISNMGTSSALSAGGIYTTAGATVAETTASSVIKDRTQIFRFAPVTLTAATAYDICLKYSSSSSNGAFYTMGEVEASVPTDVKSCRPYTVGSVIGTIGSFTPDTSQVMPISLIVDNYVAGGGGGSGGIRLAGHGGLAS